MVDRKDEAKRYGLELILLGILLTQEGEGKLLRKLIEPGMMSDLGPSKAYRAIREGNKEELNAFLITAGINRMPDETPAKAIARTFFTDNKLRFEKLLESSKKGLMEMTSGETQS